MNLVLGLVLLPLAVGCLLLVVHSDLWRKLLVVATVMAVCIGSLLLLRMSAPFALGDFPIRAHAVSQGMWGISLLIGGYLLFVGIRSKNYLVILFTLLQAGLMSWFELGPGAHVEVAQPLFVDQFAIIMALINGLIGGGICLYALGYMQDCHEHAHGKIRDRRPLFFALLFLFMGSMFGLIFTNNLVWLFLFWEITTLCSFLLIGYTQTEEAKRNAMRALVMNLAGGAAFAVAIVILHHQTGTITLQNLLASEKGLVLLPVALLCFAGITKSAQLPFSSWLLGAMVAPTPVSALLHSSTMVKAGVYLVLRIAPALSGTKVGIMAALVGAGTFVVGSLAAITAQDAKRVLAWSTVANLGLIVLCGGIGTYQAVWAGIMLIIFHAVAKCLLFLCVGLVEHQQHSRDIESMAGLIVSMPRVAVMMLVGMAGMFLAPFGMLISKWAVLKAVVDASPVLSVFIVFGSAATLFFWVKWMGKLLEVVTPPPRVSKEMDGGEAVALYGLAGATMLACLLFPLISSHYLAPYLTVVYGHTAALEQGNVLIMIIMMALVLLFPLAFVKYGRGVRVTEAYLGGANVRSSIRFRTSAGDVQDVSIGNYYLRNVFDETRLAFWGGIGSTVVLGLMVVLAFFVL